MFLKTNVFKDCHNRLNKHIGKSHCNISEDIMLTPKRLKKIQFRIKGRVAFQY